MNKFIDSPEPRIRERMLYAFVVSQDVSQMGRNETSSTRNVLANTHQENDSVNELDSGKQPSSLRMENSTNDCHGCACSSVNMVR